jgi:hypothetical protein
MDAFLLRIKRKDTLLLLIVKRRKNATVFTLRDSSKGDGRFLLCLPKIRSSPRVEGILPNEPQRSMGLWTLLESGEPNSL